MKTIQLRYFLAVAEEMSFSSAAETLYISQQAVSKQVSKLEEEYGVTFFERKPALKMTPAGEAFVETAKSILKTEADFKRRWQTAPEENQTLLRIGVGNGNSRYLIPKAIVSMQQIMPELHIEVDVGRSSILRKHLRDGALDMLIVNTFPDKRECYDYDMYSTPIADNSLIAMCSKFLLRQLFGERAQYAADYYTKNGFNLTDFQDAPFLLMEKGGATRQIIDSCLEQESLSLNVAYETHDTGIMIEMASNHFGIALIPKIQYNSFIRRMPSSQRSTLIAFPIFDKRFRLLLGAVLPRDVKYNAKMKAFCAGIREIIEQETIPLNEPSPLL